MGTPVSGATLRPFGGSVSYCPGRVFAEKQVVGFLAAVAGRYEFALAGDGKAEGGRRGGAEECGLFLCYQAERC